MGEFDLIRRFFEPVAEATAHPDLLLGPGDDCALQTIPSGYQLAFSVDTLVESVHFPRHYNPKYLGWRSLAVAVSDLAAMGAKPVCFTLALTLPEASSEWLEQYAAGLADAAIEFGIALAGGDITRGPLTLTLQVQGLVAAGQAIRRDGGQVGDLICVSGHLGEAGAALNYLDCAAPSPHVRELLVRYHRPQPRLALGQWLTGRATAAIDISDGLLSDLGHLLESGLGATVMAEAVPISDALQREAGEQALNLALTSGDDYELCFLLPKAMEQELQHWQGCRLSVIGRIEAEQGIRIRQAGVFISVGTGGYDHFGGSFGRS